jgi:RNA:NAD 2'-phosphotransferase (TPT1/KptA family)
MDRSLVTISKFLAKHLRHAPDALGLTLQPGGWVSVDDLLTASQKKTPPAGDSRWRGSVSLRGSRRE